MENNMAFWIQLFIYGISFGSFAGVVMTKLNVLEKKQDKHNGVVERLAVVEQNVKSAHHRVDEMKKEDMK